MAYSDFTLKKVKQKFNLTIVEQGTFMPPIQPITPSPYLGEFIAKNLRLALAINTEKARSEMLICPILLSVKEYLKNQISLFSGEEFNVDQSLGLNGVCDYTLSLSTEQLFIESPVVVVVEAKKEDLKGGLGQCAAEMVAAQKFNEKNDNAIPSIYGVVTTGSLWRFLKLEENILIIDLNEYLIPPIEPIIGILVQMVSVTK